VTSINFVTLVNGNSVGCLLFHCSNWCAISVLRNGNTQKRSLPCQALFGFPIICWLGLSHCPKVRLGIFTTGE
jgi:hypothetical protein